MQSHGYRIIPVNPQIEECLGEKAYASLLDVPEKIDIVNIFRRPEFVEEIVDQAIQLKVPAIWMQEDVVHEKAAEKARQGGNLRRDGPLHPEGTPRAACAESAAHADKHHGGIVAHARTIRKRPHVIHDAHRRSAPAESHVRQGGTNHILLHSHSLPR